MTTGCGDGDRVAVATIIQVLSLHGRCATWKAPNLIVVINGHGERVFQLEHGTTRRKTIGEIAHRCGIPVEHFYHVELAVAAAASRPAELPN